MWLQWKKLFLSIVDKHAPPPSSILDYPSKPIIKTASAECLVQECTILISACVVEDSGIAPIYLFRTTRHHL